MVKGLGLTNPNKIKNQKIKSITNNKSKIIIIWA